MKTLTLTAPKQAIFIQIAWTLTAILTARLLGGPQQAWSAAVGAMIASVSVGIMIWSMWQIFAKKFIALAGILIVIKYLLLAAVLYWVCSQPWLSLAWLVVGLVSVVLSAVSYGLLAISKLEEVIEDEKEH